MKRLGVALSVAVACASSGEVPLDTAFEIRYGQTVQVAKTDLSLTFADVTDSRCPRNMTCVWEGEVTVQLSGAGESVSVKAPGTARLGGYTVEVREVMPYPEDQPPPKREYRAVLVVSSS